MPVNHKLNQLNYSEMSNNNLNFSSKLVNYFSKGWWPLIILCMILSLAAYILSMLLKYFGLGS